MQERALRFPFNDPKSIIQELLEQCNYTTMHIRRIKTIAMEVLHDLNPHFVKEKFNLKKT